MYFVIEARSTNRHLTAQETHGEFVWMIFFAQNLESIEFFSNSTKFVTHSGRIIETDSEVKRFMDYFEAEDYVKGKSDA